MNYTFVPLVVSVLSHQKIDLTGEAGLTAVLSEDDEFGSVLRLGFDLDMNGVTDLGVGRVNYPFPHLKIPRSLYTYLGLYLYTNIQVPRSTATQGQYSSRF